MYLTELTKGIDISFYGEKANVSGPITGLTADSRQVIKGGLFAALPGAYVQGHTYILEAVGRGASAILTEESVLKAPNTFQLLQERSNRTVTFLTSSNVRKSFSQLAARFFGQQPEQVVAVTGTNGKSSTVSFCRQLWEYQGLKGASLGTLGLEASCLEVMPQPSFGLTTPDPVSLHRYLKEMATHGVAYLAMEASSHGLAQHRLDGVTLSAAAFTNFSQDHLDYHVNLETYFKAKKRLFNDVLEPGKTAVLNADVPEFEALEGICKNRGILVLSYGYKGKDLKILSLNPHNHMQNIRFSYMGKPYEIEIPLFGDFQVSNILCALELVIATGSKPENTITLLPFLKGVKGRLEQIEDKALVSGPKVFVDYAHTPDALKAVLEALRPHTKNQLSVVFGCGGDRDVYKRPLMGEFATLLADLVWVTDDNPRSEAPEEIRKQILKGCGLRENKVKEVEKRSEAIRQAIFEAREGDTVVILGKGHERGQIIGSTILPFDDAEVARSAIKEKVT